MKVWDIATRRSLYTIPASGPVTFDPDGKHLTVVAYSRDQPSRLLLYDAVTGAEYANWEIPGGGGVSRISFSPDGKRIAAMAGSWRQRELIVWEVESGKFSKLGQASTGVTFSPDGTRIAAFVGSETAELGLWDAVTGRKVLVLKGHAGREPRGIAFHPDGDQILSVAEWSPSGPRRLIQLEVKVWDATPWPGKP